jgi:hypothetical protein
VVRPPNPFVFGTTAVEVVPCALGPGRVFWTDRALLDLEEIGAFISADNPNAAQRWIQALGSVQQ